MKKPKKYKFDNLKDPLNKEGGVTTSKTQSFLTNLPKDITNAIINQSRNLRVFRSISEHQIKVIC